MRRPHGCREMVERHRGQRPLRAQVRQGLGNLYEAGALADPARRLLRARGEIRCAKTVAEAPGLQTPLSEVVAARKELARRPVTDEQRSKPGCIGGRTAQVISPRALSTAPHKFVPTSLVPVAECCVARRLHAKRQAPFSRLALDDRSGAICARTCGSQYLAACAATARGSVGEGRSRPGWSSPGEGGVEAQACFVGRKPFPSRMKCSARSVRRSAMT